jgi:hypothetical protein
MSRSGICGGCGCEPGDRHHAVTREELCRHAALLYAATAVVAWWDDATAGVSEGQEVIEALRTALEEYPRLIGLRHNLP